jgi:hypothetical protein
LKARFALWVVAAFAVTVVLAACDGGAPSGQTPTSISGSPNLQATIAVLETEVAQRATISVLQTQVVDPGATSEAGLPTQPPGATAVGAATRAPQPTQATQPTIAAGPTSPAGEGGTFYVATNGSDSTGDGSVVKPWATIQQALRSVPDGALILVRPGVYTGRLRLLSYRPDVTFTKGVTLRSETPYAAQLRASDNTVVTCYEECHGITMEGFDIAHLDPGTPDRVVVFHVDGQGNKSASRITLRNNIFHDSYNNDILKINNNATQVLVEGNIFYNQSSSDEHIDVNSVEDVTVQDNIFFNDFAGSGRTNPTENSSYIVIKDSNGEEDGIAGSDRITVGRNIFANWEGSEGANFVLVGEDGAPYHEAKNVTIGNNLMIGNSPNIMRAAFGVKGARDVFFRNNTITGDLPARAYAMRLNIEGENPPNENIRLVNNIWSDPAGTMGATDQGTVIRFAEVPVGETITFNLSNNLYWNGGKPIPTSEEDAVNITDDDRQKTGDPLLGSQAGIVMPRWDPNAGRFADGSSTIRAAFEQLVERYGKPGAGSAALDAAEPSLAPEDDILGTKRPVGSAPDLGAVELQP